MLSCLLKPLADRQIAFRRNDTRAGLPGGSGGTTVGGAAGFALDFPNFAHKPGRSSAPGFGVVTKP